MAVPEEQTLEDSTRDLLESPGGQILVSIRHHLKNRMYILFGLFLLGFMLAFPFAGNLESQFLANHRLADAVQDILKH